MTYTTTSTNSNNNRNHSTTAPHRKNAALRSNSPISSAPLNARTPRSKHIKQAD